MNSIFTPSENFDFDDSLDDFFKNSSSENFVKKNIHNNTPENSLSEKKNFSSDNKLQKSFQKNNFPTPKTPSMLEGFSLEQSLLSLISAMKTSFLPREETPDIRQVVIAVDAKFPFILLRKNEKSVLIGSAFSVAENAGKTYKTFGDIRLPFSEKNRLQGWILTDETLDLERVILILETLDFPLIYASHSLINRFYDFLNSDKKFEKIIAKIRFREIFGEHKNYEIAEIPFSFEKEWNEFFISFDSNGEKYYYNSPVQIKNNFIFSDENFSCNHENFSEWEVLYLGGDSLKKQAMKFTFDRFYIDEKSVGTVAGYPMGDRRKLSDAGVLVFTLEENPLLRTISGHIFIDSRGFVHTHELMRVHKEILKVIREVYEKTISDEPYITRTDLVQVLRREIVKFCFALVGRTPIVMPIITEKR